jgi:hypothetical protein
MSEKLPVYTWKPSKQDSGGTSIKVRLYAINNSSSSDSGIEARLYRSIDDGGGSSIKARLYDINDGSSGIKIAVELVHPNLLYAC